QSDGSPGLSTFPPSTPTIPRSTTTFSTLATRVANQTDVLRSNYAAVIGLWVNTRDGTVESFGGHRITTNERQLYDNLGYMSTSARELAASSPDAHRRPHAAQRV